MYDDLFVHLPKKSNLLLYCPPLQRRGTPKLRSGGGFELWTLNLFSLFDLSLRSVSRSNLILTYFFLIASPAGHFFFSSRQKKKPKKPSSMVLFPLGIQMDLGIRIALQPQWNTVGPCRASIWYCFLWIGYEPEYTIDTFSSVVEYIYWFKHGAFCTKVTTATVVGNISNFHPSVGRILYIVYIAQNLTKIVFWV